MFKKSFKLISSVFSESSQQKSETSPSNQKKEIYPPGAVDNFFDVCGACGDCRSVCPVDCIKFSSDDKTGKEIAVIVPSEKACIMCEDISCAHACQQGALIPTSENIFPKIGIAQIITETCLPHNGQSCMACYDACPLQGSAINMKSGKPVINKEYCTGCGICEEACVLDKSKGVKIFSL